MLESIHVKNLALIRESEITLGEGLNILSGETGAGKSIVIGSVNYALGAKADKDVIREGAEYALIELVFRTEDEGLIRAIREMELPVEEDGTIIITRKITPQRSVIRVCGETVTVKQVRELASLLIDIHGQHEHQSLLKASKHRELLDAYAGSEMEELLKKMGAAYTEYRELMKRKEHLSIDEGTRSREIALAEYEIRQIEEAGLSVGEEAELDEEYRRMKRGRDHHETLLRVLEYLEEDGGATDALGRSVHEMNQISEDETLSGVSDALSTAEDTVRQAVRSIRDYMEESAFDAEHFAQLESRLDTIRALVIRYGKDEKDVLDYLEKRRAELDELQDLGTAVRELEEKLGDCEKQMEDLSVKIRKLREKQGKALCKEIEKTLADLNFLEVQFSIEIHKTEEYSTHGADTVEFLISLNPGEKLRPLSEVASGGELSRIMLALKTVFAKKDEIGTLIFDEIDAGISGKTAWKVSEKMGTLAKDRQLICITHLPQIAAMADAHFCIEKGVVDGRTQTGIRELDEEEQIRELARMLGGDSVTDAVLKNAEELKKMARETKK